uniref:Potassium channel tetramerization domain containing 19 n=1 Tax=Buteo japonicus TaxID=224669 RepID=A0A8C0ANA6_9AVES
MKESDSIMESAEEELVNFNVSGWYFSIPKSKVAQFPESLLWKEASVQNQSENLRLFIDQDGFVFRHLRYYMQTSKLSFFSYAELNLLCEQILDNLKEEKYNLHVQPADIPVAERTSLNYWRTQKCTSKPPEIPPNSPAFTGLHERAPLGLADTPLLGTEDEVSYWFLPLDLVAKYPVLVNDNNLLWLLENAALIECKCSEFRFIVNFLCSEKMLLPYDFSNIDALEEEALILGIPELIDAVKIYRGNRMYIAIYFLPYMHCDLGWSCLHLSGDGILFQHARNWLGTCRLPLTENISEIKDLCEPMKDALKCSLKQQIPTAEVSVCSLHQIVKFYVGSNWYETCLQTLVKYPELLSNDKKVCWITYGQNLLIHGDGQMFRHVLNFLRLGKLFLPAEFKEWSLFCQEAEEYQIPSLLEALYHSDAYRLWIQTNELCNKVSFPCRRSSTVSWNEENEFSKDPKEVRFGFQNMFNIKDLKGKRETSGAKYSKIILWAKGTKQRNTLGGYDDSSDSLVNSSYYKHLVNPPRKGGMRSTLTKKVESKDLAKPLTVISQRVSLCNTPEKDRGVKAPVASAPVKTSYTIQGNNLITQYEVRAEGKQPEQYVFTQFASYSKTVGLILKVEHPPVLDNDGFCISNEETLFFFSSPNAFVFFQLFLLDIVFLTFAHLREEIFYARKCHFFLTNVRLKDPKEITAKAGTLVNRLCVGTSCSWPRCSVVSQLPQAIGTVFTLPFMWKYSHCLDLLIQRGFTRLVSYFALQI